MKNESGFWHIWRARFALVFGCVLPLRATGLVLHQGGQHLPARKK